MKDLDPIIRDYREDDFPAVDRLWNDTGMGGAVRGDNRESIRRTLAHGGRLLVLAEPATGEVIGTSWLTEDGRRTYLHHFAIRPDRQGRGHARQLLDASLGLAREKGLQVKLEVHRNNTRASAMYQKAGFTRLGDYDVYIIRDQNKLR